MNKNFLKFYEQIAQDQENKRTALDILQDDGQITVLNSIDVKYKAVIEIHNCINNPFYFLDKLKISQDITDEKTEIIPMPINLSSFMAIKIIHSKKNNIILDNPIGTNCNELILGYILYKLLFTDEYVILNSSNYNMAYYLKIIEDIYLQMPNYLKIKQIEAITSRILFDVYGVDPYDEILNDGIKVGLIAYIDSNSIPPSELLLSTKINIPIIVSNNGGDSRNFKYRFDKDHNAYSFKIINYDVKSLGLSNKWLEEKYEYLSRNTESYLQKVFMMYDDMTDEEAELFEKTWKDKY